MDTAQNDNSYAAVPSEVMKYLARAKLNGTQFRIIMVIWRYTFGFNRIEHSLSESFLAEATGIAKPHISRELKPLFAEKFLVIVKKATFTDSAVIAFNNNYNEWNQLPNNTTVTDLGNTDNSETVTEYGNTESTATVTENGNTTVTELGNQDIKDIKIKRSLSSELPPADSNGERVLTASEKDIELEERNEIGRTAPISGQVQSEVLEGHTDTDNPKDAKPNKKPKGKRKPIYPHDSKYYRSAKWLADKIESRIEGYSKHPESTLQNWADSARLMFERDNRDVTIANKLLLFSQEDDFWCNNILSIPRFRKQFDNLLARYQGTAQGKVKPQTSPLDTGYIKIADLIGRGEL